MAVTYIGDSNPDGSLMGAESTDKIGFLGATPVTQQSTGTAAPSTDPTVSTSTLVASLQSIAIGAASLANVNKAILTALGLST